MFYKTVANNLYVNPIKKIKTKHLWALFPDQFIPLNKDITQEMIQSFLSISSEPALIKSMTLRKFLSYCEILYDAIFSDRATQELSAIDKYRRFADGRSAGLLDLPPYDPKAFDAWYRSYAFSGNHPWEIIKSNSSDKVALIVYQNKNGWSLEFVCDNELYLRHSLRMALALRSRQVPFLVVRKQEIIDKITGEDYQLIELINKESTEEGLIDNDYQGYPIYKDEIFKVINFIKENN